MLAAAIKSCYDADNPSQCVLWSLGIRILSDFLNSAPGPQINSLGPKNQT